MSDHLLTLELLEGHLHWLQHDKQLMPGTIMAYRKVLVSYADWVNGEPLHLVAPSMIAEFIRRPRGKKAHGQPGSRATVAKDRAIISGFYKWLVNTGEIGVNPAELTVAPRLHKRVPRAIPDHIFRQVWEGALPIERVWLGLGAFVGLRRAEIVQLWADQIVVMNRTVVSFVRKGGGDDTLGYGEIVDWLHEKMPRLLPEPDEFLRPLHDLATRRVGKTLLPWDYRPATAYATEKYGIPEGSIDPQILGRFLKITLRRVGLPDAAFTPHALRHTAATNLIRSGLPLPIVSSIMNHASIETTMGYVKVSGGALAEWRRQHGAHHPNG